MMLLACQFGWLILEEVAFLFRAHLDQRLLVKQCISILCHTTFLALKRIASVHPFLFNMLFHRKACCVDDCDTTGMLLSQVQPMNKSHAYSRSIEYRHAAYLKKRKKKKKKKDSKICIQYKLAILAFDGTLPSCLPLSVHTNHCAPSGKSELEIELVHNYDVF